MSKNRQPKTSFMSEQQRAETTKQYAVQTQVIKMDNVLRVPKVKLEQLFNTLFNSGYKPLLANNSIAVFGRVVEVANKQSKPAETDPPT